MNLDRTFCSSVRCGKQELCDRSHHNLVEYLKTSPLKVGRNMLHVSIADFSDHEGKCDRFDPIDKVNQAPHNKA